MVSLCVSCAENGDKNRKRLDRTIPGGGRTGPKHWEQSEASATSKPEREAKRTSNPEQPGPSKNAITFAFQSVSFQMVVGGTADCGTRGQGLCVIGFNV